MSALAGSLKDRQIGLFLITSIAFLSVPDLAHAISDANAQFVETIDGPAIAVFMYLGAKHMFTGVDHLLFLLGVIFFLYRLRDVVLYVSIFTLGHSATLLLGVLSNFGVNPQIVDAIIGISVVFKAFDNLNGFKTLFGFQPNIKIAIFVFGLFHGLGLATKLQEILTSNNGLWTNLLSFNVGVEIGQIAALSLVIGLLTIWRKTNWFQQTSTVMNGGIMCAGFILTTYHLIGYWYT